MIYSEAAYFDGVHVQHCADREEHFRLKRKRDEMQKAARYFVNPRLAAFPVISQIPEAEYGDVIYLEDYRK